jgi:hypothetical protein
MTQKHQHSLLIIIYKVAIATTLAKVLINAVVNAENLHKHPVPKMKWNCSHFKQPIVTNIIPIGNQTGNSADCDNALISITSKLPMAP